MKKKATTIIRILFGLMLFGFGVSGLLNHFVEFMPSQYSGSAKEFIDALNDTGYIMVFVCLLKISVGVCLLINRFVPLALVLFAPISVNMLLFHVFLDLASIVPALVLCFFNVYLLIANIEKYKPFLVAKN